MTTNQRLQLTRVDTFEEFHALKADWDALATTQIKTIFLTHEWLSQWWQFFGAEGELWTLVARDAGEVVGIVPLMLRRSADGFRRLMFMGSGKVTPNHLDLIAQAERRDELVRALSTYLGQTHSQWDIFELDKLPADTNTAEQLAAYLRIGGLTAQIQVSAQCPYATLPDSFERFLQTRSANTRENFRYARNSLKRRFTGARFARVQSPSELNLTMDALIRMHQARWTAKGYTGAFSNDGVIRFHRAVALGGLRTGQLRLYYLQIDSLIAAVHYCYRIADRVQYYLGGFDDRWAKSSPGILINGYALEQSIAECAHEFDFLEGDEPYKHNWATHTRDNLRLRVFSPHWRGRLAHARTQAVDRFIGWSIRRVPVQVRRPLWLALQRLKADRRQAGVVERDK